MYADRYAPKRVNRGSLGLTVAVVAPLLTIAMLSTTTITRGGDVPGIDIFIPAKDPPPPPPEKPPELQPRANRDTVQTAPDPVIKTPAAPDKPWVAPPETPPPPTPGEGLASGGGMVEPIKPPPVITGVEIDPRYANAFQPLYPPAEQRAGRDGVVTLKVLVGTDGRVVRAEQVTATSDEFWRVTLKQALGRWCFKPATRDGVAIEAWRTMTVRFQLEDA